MYYSVINMFGYPVRRFESVCEVEACHAVALFLDNFVFGDGGAGFTSFVNQNVTCGQYGANTQNHSNERL
jgi:hypothetical protein